MIAPQRMAESADKYVEHIHHDPPRTLERAAFIAGAEWAALQKEPPALPAEVEAVLAKLELQSVVPNQEMTLDEVRVTKQCLSEAATLLRRYAQAVAEKDAEIARLTEAGDAKDRRASAVSETIETLRERFRRRQKEAASGRGAV